MSELNDSQRAHLLQLYRAKLQQLGDDVFFDKFDEIREECYESMGIEMESEISQAASQLGKRGGSSKSESKSLSSRSNGKKGGRPKATQLLDMEDI